VFVPFTGKLTLQNRAAQTRFILLLAMINNKVFVFGRKVNQKQHQKLQQAQEAGRPFSRFQREPRATTSLCF